MLANAQFIYHAKHLQSQNGMPESNIAKRGARRGRACPRPALSLKHGVQNPTDMVLGLSGVGEERQCLSLTAGTAG